MVMQGKCQWVGFLNDKWLVLVSEGIYVHGHKQDQSLQGVGLTLEQD